MQTRFHETPGFYCLNVSNWSPGSIPDCLVWWGEMMKSHFNCFHLWLFHWNLSLQCLRSHLHFKSFQVINKTFFLPQLSCTVDFSCFQFSNFSQHWLHSTVWTLEVASFFSGLQLTFTTYQIFQHSLSTSTSASLSVALHMPLQLQQLFQTAERQCFPSDWSFGLKVSSHQTVSIFVA